MKKEISRWWLCISFTLFSLSFKVAFSQDITQSTKYCFRCHSMATLGYRNIETGVIINLSVDPDKYKHSNHANLECIRCHQAGYESFPHSETAKSKKLYCLDCHKNEPKFDTYRFPHIEKEFFESIHYQKLADKFNCFSCHNPHEFEITSRKKSISQLIEYDNAICLRCHASPVRFAELTSREFPLISLSHQWLPNTELHWKSVRCVECHTPHTDVQSHEILSAENAEKNCVKCHTANSILLTQLYKYRSQEERQKVGFINSVALNNAYIIGMTRNIFLDQLSIVIFGFVLIGILGHAVGRWIYHRRRKP